VTRAASSRRSYRRPAPSSVQHDRLFNNGSNGPLTCGGLHERLSLEGGEPTEEGQAAERPRVSGVLAAA
jgi:hypothetical protein